MTFQPAVFLVFPQNRVQQLYMFLRNAFLSGLWSRSVLVEIFLFVVQVLVSFSRDRVQQLLVPSRSPTLFLLEVLTVLPGQVLTASPGPVHVDEHLPDSAEWVQLRDEATSKPYFWNRRTRVTKWKPPPGIRVVWVGCFVSWTYEDLSTDLSTGDDLRFGEVDLEVPPVDQETMAPPDVPLFPSGTVVTQLLDCHPYQILFLHLLFVSLMCKLVNLL